MNKILISTFIAFAIGFFSSRFISNSSSSTNVKDSSTGQCTNLADAKSSLMSISKNEYLEYTKIKDLKQKYEKADELLGKIMLLFLADVGFRLQKDVIVEPVSTGVSTVASPSQNTTTPFEKSPSAESLPEASPVKQSEVSPLEGKSSVIKTSQSEKQIRDILDSALIEDPKIEAAKGGTPTPTQQRRLEGRYAGAIKFLDNKRASLSVVWELIPDNSKGEMSGTFNLNIHGPGKNSESSGSGNIDTIISLAEDKDGFLVRGCGGDCYLQLYYNAPGDQFFGNYYEMINGTKKSARLGIVELKK